MKIVFFGTSEFAVPALEALTKAGLAPVAVVTSPDKPSGRGLKISSPPVKQFLKDARIVIMQPETLDEKFIQKIRDLKPDIGVVAAYGKILPKALIEAFPYGILNIHPSLLPKYRGASPIEYTVLAGEENNTGVSIILLDEKMDHGPVLVQSKLALGGETAKLTYFELHDALAKLGAEMIVDTLPKWIEKKIEAIPQEDEKATFTKLIKKENGKIDWEQPAAFIERMTRAYEKWPGAYAELGGGVLKIKKSEVVERHLTMQAGTVFEKDGFPCVACGERALKLLTVQPEGKNEMPGDAYLRGHREILT
ncbi:methionyl-tRNA formyltransferase [Candidatus Giovannonibacteria bacterium RIFCSPHIGHO2_01_FULL_45_33]|uniref:Methionyl-tRNA formyltransferase n=1 Tax=Candidatus Giovannonibacteria bacterium RIFCSPLOWO2_01_FULL_45_34 TaxID=1798351 RepID=A0A1F5WYM5_9BACT|nr:MAG: methionyl-tRNA formyltransferase [Candidatus Giovannonibacteria bacterium RIFCSPHIGHO2_01_FULL_45_33]OGF80744.1 MAG: methionyl-tRNA formyltransferase [Candidatus Giovannonibacteria bacterium RIFCSPLOWO2_01_FULL_45_34]